MKNNDYFCEIFRESPVPTLVILPDAPIFTVLDINNAYCSLIGVTKEAITGKALFTLGLFNSICYETKSVLAVKEALERTVQEKTTIKTPVQAYQMPVKGTDAFHDVYLESVNTPILDEQNNLKYIIRSVTDVTALVHAQEQQKAIDASLLKNEKFLRETQKVAQIGSWEINMDNRVRWSDVTKEILEVPQDYLPTIEEGVNFYEEGIHRDIFSAALQRAMETGESFDLELKLITGKGNEKRIRCSGKGEMVDRKCTRVYGTAQDITARKLVEDELVNSKNHLESLIQTVEGVVWQADVPSFQLTFVSDQITALLGYTVEECLNEPDFWMKCLHPADKEEVLRYSAQQVQAGKNYSLDYRMLRKDGSEVWTKSTVSIIHEGGEPKWLRGLMLDITASKRLTNLVHLEKSVLELNANPANNIESVLRAYLLGIEAIFPQMRCSIMRAKNGHLFNWVSLSLPPAYNRVVEKLPIADNTGSCGTAAHLKQRVIVSDIATDAKWSSFKDAALQYNLRSCWSYPIVNNTNEVVATLAMYYATVKTPTEDELKVIERTAAILKVIIENRRNSELLEEANLAMKQSQEIARFGSVHMDLETNELIWSDEFYSIFGVEKDGTPPTVQRYLDCLHPDDRARVKSQIDIFLKTKQDYHSEERIIRPNGQTRYIRTWGRLKTNEKGEPVKIISACMDITANKKTQEELIASETRLRNLVESQTNYVIRTTLFGEYTYANKKYIEDFGLRSNDSLLDTNSMDSILPVQWKEVIEITQKCIAHPNQVFQIELDKFAKDGSIKSTFWHFICLTNSQGEPSEIQCIGIDITDRKQAEYERLKKTLELAESEKRYSDLFHLSPQPMWVFDLDTLKFLDVNQAAIQHYGYSKEEFLSMTIKDIRSEGNIAALLESAGLSKKHPDRFSRGIFTHQKKNGESIQVEIISRHIPSKGEKARLVLATDITERIKYLETLERQNERLREIAWIQSHVVRAPLARIMGLVDVLRNYAGPDLDKDQLLDHIAASSCELDKIIKDIAGKAEQVKLNEPL